MGTDGRTDRQTDRLYEANGRFSQFCEGAYKPIGRDDAASDAPPRLKVSRLLYVKGNVLIAQYGVVISFPFDVVTDEHANLNPRYL
jgi:hypothetical protein